MKLQLNYKTPYLYLTGLILLVSGLPVSLFLTSLAQFFLAGSFLFEGNVKDKFKRFFSNRTAMFIAGIWILHLIGLMWTSELSDGLKDLRIKLPLLILPLIIAGNQPLTAKQFKLVLSVFVFAVLAGTFSAMAVLTGLIHREIHDIRDIFIYHISHIRFALFTCIAIVSMVYYLFYTTEVKGIQKVILPLLISWFVLFLIVVESLTGIITLTIILFAALTYQIFKSKNKLFRFGFFVFAIGIPLAMVLYLSSLVKKYYVKKEYQISVGDTTALGNHYEFHPENMERENGYPVNMYVCESELRSAWNERSAIDYDSLDNKGQRIYSTIIRFLTSKGLKKDDEGVKALNEFEIKSIENGIANFDFQETSNLQNRIRQVIWEFDQLVHGENPSGHSVSQRFEFWKAAVGIIAAHPFIGVGTGDLPLAFKEQYVSMNTQLDQDHRLRAHNQYLAITVAFGIIGLIYFLFALLYPVLSKQNYSMLFVFFLIIAMVSMLTEDTLETQPGATFAAFFYLFFFTHVQNKSIIKPE